MRKISITQYVKIGMLCCLLQVVAVPAFAQMKMVTGRVLQKQFGENGAKPFEEEVRIFAFNMKRDFKKALDLVDKPGSFIMDYDSETTADEQGYYSISVSPKGYLLVLTGNMSHGHAEVDGRMMIDFMLEAGKTLDQVDVVAKARVAVVDSMDVIDTGSTIECSSILTLPSTIGKANARCVFQPIVIDCETEDTVEFLAPKVYDGAEYSKVQLQRMAFDMKNDVLHPYIQKEVLGNTELKIRWKGSIKKINRKHNYTCMGAIRVADYQRVFYSENKQISSCMARRPFQFMEYEASLPQLDKEKYKEVPRGELRDGTEMISLSFLLGTAELDPDPKNEAELERLNGIFRRIDQSAEYQMRRIAITGYASPEGNYQSNLHLAKARANMAKNLVAKNFTSDVYIYTNEPEVIGWGVVADSLDAKGMMQEAAEIRAAVEANTDNLTEQSKAIAQLAYYEETIKPILPSLRIFKCEYVYQTVRALQPEEIMDNYLNNPEYRVGGTKQFNRYDYWHLFEMVKDSTELHNLYLRAYNESKQSSSRPWVYAAHKLALSYHERDTFDVEVLRPFVDINAKGLNIERRTFAGHKYVVNQEEVLAAQVANYYRAEHNDTAYYLARMLPDKEEYKELKSFALVRGLLFRPNKTDEQKAQLEVALAVVMNSSTLNRAILEVAMKKDAEARETLKLMADDDPRKWYMFAILDSRAMNLGNAAAYLNQCFMLDPEFEFRMLRDGDISDDVKETWSFTYGDF